MRTSQGTRELRESGVFIRSLTATPSSLPAETSTAADSAAAMDDLDELLLLGMPLEPVHWPLSSPGTPSSTHGGAESSSSSTDSVTHTRSPATPAKRGHDEPGRDEEQERKATAKRVRAGKSSSQKQREEIARLRQQASELQAQIARLRGMDPASLDQSGSDALAANGPTALSKWVGITRRQQQEEKRAEETNAKLRDELREHSKYVRRLSRLLRKSKVSGSTWRRCGVGMDERLMIERAGLETSGTAGAGAVADG